MAYLTDRAFAFLFLALLSSWISLVAMSAAGLGRHFPSLLRHPANVTHLFTRRVDAWAWCEVQGRFTGGGGRWVPLRLADYSHVENYGYLTRLDRMLDEAGSRQRGPGIRLEMARWLASAHARRFPESPALREVRYLRVAAPVGSDLLARPPGRWVRPPLESLPAAWVREIGVVTDRQWTTMKPLESVR
jgi:hypothetical protein